MKRPSQLPPSVYKKIKKGTDPLERMVCDYIAGMTDRFALDEHRKLFLPYEDLIQAGKSLGQFISSYQIIRRIDVVENVQFGIKVQEVPFGKHLDADLMTKI